MTAAAHLFLPSLIGDGVLQQLTAVAAVMPSGAFVEVGVYQGGSAQRLLAVAQTQGRALWLFDTFAGIPWKGFDDRHEVGDFADVDFPALEQALQPAHLIRGVFPQTFTPAVAAAIGPIAFAHVDCDQYDSVSACIRELGPRMVPGGVMWFDDVECLPGATRAAREAMDMHLIQLHCGKWIHVAH